jgi:hypothetical protein
MLSIPTFKKSLLAGVLDAVSAKRFSAAPWWKVL